MYKARLKGKYKARSANDHALAVNSRIRAGGGIPINIHLPGSLLDLTVKTQEQERNTPRQNRERMYCTTGIILKSFPPL